MTCKPGDIVLIPFPYSDLSSHKRRPVLVLTSPDRHGDFIAMAITSVAQAEPAVALKDSDLATGKLPKQSWIRIDKIFTLSEQSIAKRVAELEIAVLTDAVSRFCRVLGHNGKES